MAGADAVTITSTLSLTNSVASRGYRSNFPSHNSVLISRCSFPLHNQARVDPGEMPNIGVCHKTTSLGKEALSDAPSVFLVLGLGGCKPRVAMTSTTIKTFLPFPHLYCVYRIVDRIIKAYKNDGGDLRCVFNVHASRLPAALLNRAGEVLPGCDCLTINGQHKLSDQQPNAHAKSSTCPSA